MTQQPAWSRRLAALGLELPAAAKPVAAYVPAVAHGDLLFVSGQLPLVDGALRYTGRLGADLGLEEGQAAARQCALLCLAAAAAAAPGGPAALAGVLRVEGFVQCTPAFTDQARVCNGASELFGALFPGQGHARVAVGVAALPLGAAVEIAAVFVLADPVDEA